MSARLYSEVVSGNGSSSSSEIEEPSETLGMVNWLEEYQTEDEHVALQKAINLSKVIFRTSSWPTWLGGNCQWKELQIYSHFKLLIKVFSQTLYTSFLFHISVRKKRAIHRPIHNWFNSITWEEQKRKERGIQWQCTDFERLDFNLLPFCFALISCLLIFCVRRRRTLPNRDVTWRLDAMWIRDFRLYVAFASFSCGDVVERTRVCGITVHSAASDRL